MSLMGVTIPRPGERRDQGKPWEKLSIIEEMLLAEWLQIKLYKNEILSFYLFLFSSNDAPDTCGSTRVLNSKLS